LHELQLDLPVSKVSRKSLLVTGHTDHTACGATAQSASPVRIASWLTMSSSMILGVVGSSVRGRQARYSVSDAEKTHRLERVAPPSEQDELTIVLAVEAVFAYDTSATWQGARARSALSLKLPTLFAIYPVAFIPKGFPKAVDRSGNHKPSAKDRDRDPDKSRLHG
jgi:hypothetical protein